MIRYCLGLLVLLLIGCKTLNPTELTILSGSENKSLEPLIKEFGKKNGIAIKVVYKGSVDIMLELGKETLLYDAIWPANSMWISLGDRNRRIKHSKSIMNSPVVFGIKKSLAQSLGFIGREVTVSEIVEAVEQKKLTFMMTSATQSNSGASGYLGFLYALSGNPDILTMESIHTDSVRHSIQTLLAGVHRSSGSSGWLKDLFLQGNYNAMVNYEALIIETNKELQKASREPLYIIYPTDGIVMADSPLGFVNRGSEKKEKAFLKLQEYLLSDETQSTLKEYGRRTGFGGIVGKVDKAVFNPEWGIDVEKILSPIRIPSSAVVYEALHLYQTDFRKPSLTVFCLDFSGSMQGDGERQLKDAMDLLLKKERAQQFLLQSGNRDIIYIVPFSHHVRGVWRASGGESDELDRLQKEITMLIPQGKTAIYSAAKKGIEAILSEENMEEYIPAIILMSDGESNSGVNIQYLQEQWNRSGKDIPIFSIMFGAASEGQLKEIAEFSRGRVFDGRDDLVGAFRKAKGYN